MASTASGAASTTGSWVRQAFKPIFNKIAQLVVSVVPKSVGPKVGPLVELSADAPQYTPEALGLRYGLLLIPPLITFCIIVYTCLQFTGSSFFGPMVANCSSTLQNCTNPQRKDSKSNRVFKILWRVIHWPVYFFIAVIRLFFSLFNIQTFLFLIVFVMLTYIGINLEENQNDLIAAMDDTLAIGRGLYNFAGGVLNSFWSILYAFLAPIYNVVVEFAYTIGAITYKYMAPIFQGKRLPPEFTGRRSLEDASVPYIGEGFILALRVIGNIHEALLSMFFTFVAYLYDLIMYIVFGVGDYIVRKMLNLVSGFHCYIDSRYFKCTFLQILEALGEGIALILNIFVDLILTIGIGSIPGVSIGRVPSNLFPVQCTEARADNGQLVSPKDCEKCKRAFPGWEKDCALIESSTRRILTVSCDELPDNRWQEIVYWHGDILEMTGTPSNVSNYHACPVAKKLLVNNDLNVYYKYFGDYVTPCITVQVNMKTVITCPQYDPHAPTAKAIKQRRNLLATTPTTDKNSDDLVDAFKQETKKNSKTKAPDKITRELYAKHYKQVNEKVNKKENTIFDCTQHENTSHLFDVMCGMQALSMREEMFHSMKSRATESVTSFYNKKYQVAETRRRRATESGIPNEEYPALHFSSGRLLGQIGQAIYDYDAFVHAQNDNSRELQQEIKLINKTLGTNSCAPGYTPCRGSNYCEIPHSCVCPRPTRAFASITEEVLYNIYLASCDSGDLAMNILGEIGKCWAEYKKDDTTNPFVKVGGQFETVAQKNRKVYCIPLIGPDSFRFQKWDDWSLQTYLITTYCNETTTPNTISDCVCPGYDQGVTAYDAEWKQGLGYYIYASLKNTGKIIATWFFGLLNSGGYLNYIWSGFWGSFGLFPPEFVNAFDVTLSWHDIQCTFFFSGSLFRAFGWFFIFCKLVWAFLPCFVLIFDDIVFIIVVLAFNSYEEALVKYQKQNQKNLEDGMNRVAAAANGLIPFATEVKEQPSQQPYESHYSWRDEEEGKKKE